MRVGCPRATARLCHPYSTAPCILSLGLPPGSFKDWWERVACGHDKRPERAESAGRSRTRARRALAPWAALSIVGIADAGDGVSNLAAALRTNAWAGPSAVLRSPPLPRSQTLNDPASAS